MKQIGITTTVPVEVIMAAGYQPIDLNNVFVSDPAPEKSVNLAERAGFPLNCCTWIKGIYGVTLRREIHTVLCVTTGDCSNTIMLMEVFKLKGLKVIPFAFPTQPDQKRMQTELEHLATILGTTMTDAAKVRKKVAPARNLVRELDCLTWQQNRVSGYENHLALVSTSDFNRDYTIFHKELKQIIDTCQKRTPYPHHWLRLAYIGVPPVFARDLYSYIETFEAHVVFNEVQRQFAMPEPGKSLAEQYTNYTYPYSIYDRLKDIKTEINNRRVDGVIHYIQAFCHRGIGDIIFRQSLGVPILTIEGNQDFYLTQHIKTRVEAFLDMVRKKSKSNTNNTKA